MKSQLGFKATKSKYEFGGDLLKRARNRHARPVSTKDPTHLILKSSKAVGRQSFGHSRNLRETKALIERMCVKYGVKLIMYSNNFNHLHMLVRFPSRQLYLRFIRALTGALAMLVTGAKKSKSMNCVQESKTTKFFDSRPFTRIVRGFRPYKIVCDYIRLNQLEAAGVILYQVERLKNLSELERAFF